MRRVIFSFYFLRTGSAGGGGAALLDFFFFLLFLCSADHERIWQPCKVVFFGLATNVLNVRNNSNNKVTNIIKCEFVATAIILPYNKEKSERA